MKMLASRVAGIACVALALPGCERAMHDMYDQRRYKPLAPSEIFPHGQIARPLPDGTVVASAGALAGTSSGRLGDQPVANEPAGVVPIGDDGQPLLHAGATPASLQPASRNPLPITMALLARGRERFDIYCTPCHGVAGFGDGVVVQRGFPAPPSYHTERLRRAPDSHFYGVITHGYGAMFSYADRVESSDRWAIVAYIRALQLSQHAQWSDLPADVQARPELQPPAK